MVGWEVLDDNIKPIVLETLSYLIPKATIRLFSPQDYFNSQNSGSFECFWNKSILKIRGCRIKIPYCNCNNIPMINGKEINIQRNSSSVMIVEDLTVKSVYN